MNIKKLTLAIFVGLIFNISCSKDPVTTANKRNVKYELTGNYSGYLNIIYSDNISGNTNVAVTAFPWSKDIAYSSNVQAIGIGGIADVTHRGTSGQNAVLKIYSGGVVVKTITATADASGTLNLLTTTYVFP